MAQKLSKVDQALATAIIGIDTLWGGDVNNPSGTGRFIADCWFSDVALPAAYAHPLAAKLRESGGVSARQPDRPTIDAYIQEVDVPGAIREIHAQARQIAGVRSATLKGLAECLHIMWDLAMEMIGKGDPVPYERCMRAATGVVPHASDPKSKRQQLAELL